MCRLPFRLLVREYGCDLAFTPMLMSESFIKSERYREIEYSTDSGTQNPQNQAKYFINHFVTFILITEDNPLIVQFAANNAQDFVSAAELAYKYASAALILGLL